EGTRPAGTEPATSRGFDLEALATTEEAFDVGVQAIVHCDGGAGGDSEEWLLACARTVPDRPGEPGRCLARGWVLRQSVQPYLSPGMELPGPFISPAAAEELRLRHDAAKQRLAACEEEFRKFRVSANTTIRQLKEAGVPETQAQATQEPLPSRPAVHAEGTVPLAALADIKAELRATQQELAAVAHERAELSVRVERLRKEVQSTRAAHTSTKDEVEAWRLRCLEAEAALGGAAPAATPQRPAASGGTGDAPPAVQLAKLQQEFSTYRSQAVGLLRGKVETIAALKARVAELEGADSTVQAVDDSLLTAAGAEYLRNVLLQYMCAHDGSIRRTLEATIATVLHFTPEEIRRVKAARDSAASAAGVAGSIFSSLGSALTSVVLQAFRSFPMKHPDGSPRDHGAAQSARHSHSAQQPSTAAAVAEPGKAKAPQARTEAAPAKTPKQHVSDPAPTAAPAQVPATVAASSQPTTQQPPRVTAEGHQVPIGNGGVGPDGQYVWTQTIYDTTVHVPVPAAVKSSHVTCTFTPTALNLRVAVPGHPPIALQGTLGGDVKAGDCLWTLEREAAGAVLTLALEKGTETWWRSVLEGHPTIDATRVDSTRQVTEYDEETQATIRKLMAEQHEKRLREEAAGAAGAGPVPGLP
ncbi:BOB1, partial [Symbiodinium sp. KB8]